MSEFLQSAASWKMRTCVLILVSIIVEYLLYYNQISFIAQQAMASDFALRNFLERQGETRKKLFALDNIPADGTTIKNTTLSPTLRFSSSVAARNKFMLLHSVSWPLRGASQITVPVFPYWLQTLSG